MEEDNVENEPLENQISIDGKEQKVKRKYNKNDIMLHKDNALKRLDLSFLKHIDLKEYKKSELLAYWINDFANYHDNEKNFDISKSGVYKRGDIIKVNLGFNIGNELGGLHYCVIINKYDNTKNGILNVLPLSSKKNNKKYASNTVNIGYDLYNRLNASLQSEKNEFKAIINEIDKIRKHIPNIDDYVKVEEKYINKIEKEISKMNYPSIVLVNQITSISKQRIYKDRIIRNISLSENSLDLIDKKISKIFLK